MFCPKCGVENPDGASFCRGCGSAITAAKTASPAPAAKTSGMAIASMVFGILSFCTFLLTAPIAFILGIISLVMITKSKGQLKGTGFAVAGIVTPVVALPFVALVMGIMMPALARTRMIVYRMNCGENLAGLGKAMLLYSGDNNDKFPSCEQWCDLLIEYEDVDPNQFRCRGASKGPCNYSMNKNVEELGAKAPADMVLLFESKPGWNQSGGPELLSIGNHQEEGCNVLFCDGHVAFVKTEEIDTLKWTAGP
ncbi:MAG: DUF4190 domain-containing protein [Sedimentisphaerales bacterium]|nr:DUF4190 domain-containing protein [Sedimentisphaerales bacterium]